MMLNTANLFFEETWGEQVGQTTMPPKRTENPLPLLSLVYQLSKISSQLITQNR
jgi:hypothetical protein